MIDPQKLKHQTFPERTFCYEGSDNILYALCTGMSGSSNIDENELPFVIEGPEQRTLPTMITALAFDADWVHQVGINASQVLHTEHRLGLHKVFPPRGKVTVSARIGQLYDRGPERGAILSFVSEIRDARSGEALAGSELIVLARADGGFGGEKPPYGDRIAIPESYPDFVIETPTSTALALNYRLLGDDNPIHSSPVAARQAGFDRPILHGLCTFGIACRAVVVKALGGTPDNISHVEASFTAAVFPGETLRTSIWSRDGGYLFRTDIVERPATALNRGRIRLR